ncbi:MAG: hypothetical protein ABIS50_23060 [Luteolibacter sp.]|uniref:hypothetical protein n=1 Tax=Luteolibacter sp. TaxID=1962973 RepID=UPI003263BB9A
MKGATGKFAPFVERDRTSRISEFARGFFNFLQSKGVPSAILHGGGDGFENPLSDVDFAVAGNVWGNLTRLIHEYCGGAGWRLCQVLRHEPTAAYHVCSAIDDPACAVALDACSDYQRNGTVYLTASELLEERKPYLWGGFSLTPEKELCYRFAKAAAKSKEVAGVAEEFARYPEPARKNCETWLAKHWGIILAGWDPEDLKTGLGDLRRRSNRRPPVFNADSFARIVSRILSPSGMIVVTGGGDFDEISRELEATFGHLYFRRFLKVDRWKPALIKGLVASTVIVVPEMPGIVESLLPADCVYRPDGGQDTGELLLNFARCLAERCARREMLSNPG